MYRILVVLLLISIKVQSQKIEYSFKNNEAYLKFVLLVDHQSDIAQWKMLQNSKGENVENSSTDFFIKKNNKIFTKEKTINSRVFITDDVDLKWSKADLQKKILGYDCKSAVADFRGRKYIAYYTTDIQIPSGPWKFGGLDGLILSIESEDGAYKFEAAKINLEKINLDQTNIKNILANNEFVGWDRFVEIYNNSITDYINNEKCNCSEDGKNILRISRIEKIHPNLHDQGIVY